MYSSAPHVIKHYVPMNFSRMSIDYQSSPKKAIINIKPVQSNPLTNFKLKRIEDKPKDYVLIFKNKSVKQFAARKKITFSTKFKKMQRTQSQIASNKNDKGIINIQNFDPIQQKPIRVKSSSRMDQDWKSAMKLRRRFQYFQQNGSRRTAPLRQNKTSSTVRRCINKAYDTARQGIRQNVRSSLKNRKSSHKNLDHQFFYKQFEQQHFQQTQNLINLKISGTKAPSSEIVDHFKRYSMQGNNYILDKLVK